LISAIADNDRQLALTNNVNLPDHGSYQNCTVENQPV